MTNLNLNRDLPIIIVTDFGPDSAKGRMKASLEDIRSRFGRRSMRILDEVHSVPPFQVLAGSFELGEEAEAWAFREPVILGVVDPGVGTERPAIALRTENGIYYVGPDNGLPHHLLQKYPAAFAVELDAKYRRVPSCTSSTFDGRDLFAVAAAKLSCRVPLEDLGQGIDPRNITRLQIPDGTVQYLDTVSGTAKLADIALADITCNGRGKLLAALQYGCVHNLLKEILIDRSTRTECRKGFPSIQTKHAVTFARSFGETKPGAILLYPGSSRTPELAVNLGNARDKLSLAIGDTVQF